MSDSTELGELYWQDKQDKYVLLLSLLVGDGGAVLALDARGLLY